MVARSSVTAGGSPLVSAGACLACEGLGRPLPARPIRDLPEDHCLLPGCRFTQLPLRCRAEITLPPMQPARTRSDPALLRGGRGRNARRSNRQPAQVPVKTVKCFGDFCDAEIRFPASLQDIDSSDHPWLRKGRELCRTSTSGTSGASVLRGRSHTLLLPEELVACLQQEPECSSPAAAKEAPRPRSQAQPPVLPSSAPPRAASAPPSAAQPFAPPSTGTSAPSLSLPPSAQGTGAARAPAAAAAPLGRVCASWLLEARLHPRLCGWLRSDMGWLLDPGNTESVLEVAKKLREDEEAGGGPPGALTDSCLQGLRYRLQEVPVCTGCYRCYAVIHGAIAMIRTQHRDVWAIREQRRRRLEEELERQQSADELLELALARPRQRSADSACSQMRRSKREPTSLVLDSDMRDWLYSSRFEDEAHNVTPKTAGSSAGAQSPGLATGDASAKAGRRRLMSGSVSFF